MRRLLVVAAVSVLVACSTAVTKEDVSKATFAAKPTDSHAMASIQNYLNRVLVDPESLRLNCSKVTDKAWARQTAHTNLYFGYGVFCEVNSKNRLGGYVGNTPYLFLFNGKYFEVFEYEQKYSIDLLEKRSVIFGLID